MAFLFMKKYIPNTITSLNLFSGCIAVLFVLQGSYWNAFYCVVASGVFDFFDGMSARALHVKSLIGKELDSLADVISFGFVPGALLYMLLKSQDLHPYVPYLGFIVTVFSALRLAKFNIDTRQTTDFIGVNTPMNTFVIMSIPFIAENYPMVLSPYVLIPVIFLSSFLLVSEIKLFSMKLDSLSWKINQYKYIFLLLSVLLLFVFKFLALPIILVFYIVLSKIHFNSMKN
ncbi:CDP-diacylglycerol--serine O-phosphatidyltransferase [Sphingobacterium sp. HJSM2_6]|uniref:CDP-diacylglycerol--serine O-phosphatidyltransferase n=1 Tax=Sphingobacterium sp. HJSM2_6 TaxID=3366264 RepID=UPI003BF4BB3B